MYVWKQQDVQCILLSLFLYVMKLYVLSCYKAHIISLCTETMETSIKMFLNKNHVNRGVKKVLKQEDCHAKFGPGPELVRPDQNWLS